MALNVKLLKKICEASGAPGYETEIRNIVHQEVKSLADEVSIDRMGNLIAIKKGKKEKTFLPHRGGRRPLSP